MAFIKRHPVLTFYALAFALSWGGILTSWSAVLADTPAPRSRSRSCSCS
jgi:hypothetical protein